MSTTHSRSRSAPAHQNVCATLSSKNDRGPLCTFTFADGRRCRTPRCSAHLHLCYFHARKEAQARAAEDFARSIAPCFSRSYLSACDLSAALGRLFTATACGNIKPKTAATLAYLGQVLVQTIQLAEKEYIEAFDTDSWRDAIASRFPDAEPPDPPPPAPRPLSPQPSSSRQPACDSFTPPPATSTTRLSASTRPKSPASSSATLLAAPALPPPGASSSPTPTQTSVTVPLPAAPTPSTPKPPQSTASLSTPSPPPASPPPTPPALPRGFGQPANWDVLIPSKPVRRRRRQGLPWYYPE